MLMACLYHAGPSRPHPGCHSGLPGRHRWPQAESRSWSLQNRGVRADTQHPLYHDSESQPSQTITAYWLLASASPHRQTLHRAKCLQTMTDLADMHGVFCSWLFDILRPSSCKPARCSSNCIAAKLNACFLLLTGRQAACFISCSPG